MARYLGFPAVLRLQESTQSGDYTMTGSWSAVFSYELAIPWLFARGVIDLSNMVAGDVVHVRTSTINESGGSYIVLDEMKPFYGVQSTGHKEITLGAIPNTYGVKIEMYQSVVAASYIVVPCYFFYARR